MKREKGMPVAESSPLRDRERQLAARMAHERTSRGMTYEALALHMSEVGCEIDKSSLYKIEKGVPPRRITVEEALALAAVFRLRLEDLLLPVEVARDKELRTLVARWKRALRTAAPYRQKEKAAFDEIAKRVVTDEDARRALRPILDAELSDETSRRLIEGELYWAAKRASSAKGDL